MVNALVNAYLQVNDVSLIVMGAEGVALCIFACTYMTYLLAQVWLLHISSFPYCFWFLLCTCVHGSNADWPGLHA